MNDDLISRKAAVDALGDIHPLDYNGQSAKARIEKLPAEQARQKGRWEEKEVIRKGEAQNFIEEWQSARCSHCGKYHTTPFLYYFNEYDYCPHCGEWMRGVTNERPYCQCRKKGFADGNKTIKEKEKVKYKIKVGNKYLVGMSLGETLKGTVRGDTTAVYSRFVGEMSAYDFCDNIEGADPKDAVTACDYVRGIMERQGYGFYNGEIKLIGADAEETVVHCKKEENATLIAMILNADAEGKVWALDFYENHVEPPKKEGANGTYKE